VGFTLNYYLHIFLHYKRLKINNLHWYMPYLTTLLSFFCLWRATLTNPKPYRILFTIYDIWSILAWLSGIEEEGAVPPHPNQLAPIDNSPEEPLKGPPVDQYRK
jgi:hypothetical protein